MAARQSRLAIRKSLEGPIGELNVSRSTRHMNTSAPERSRPITVQIAVAILAVSVGIGMVKLTLGAHLDNPLTYLLLAAVLGVSTTMVWLIFRGRNWARWV